MSKNDPRAAKARTIAASHHAGRTENEKNPQTSKFFSKLLNVSHHGDATTNEMSWPKQQGMIDALRVPSNWPTGGKPDAILFSGGGNDIAGDQFCVFLDYAKPGAAELNDKRFQEAFGMVEASYRDLFAFRDRFAHGVPIFAHCYDFAIPNGVATFCAGPWLKPSLDFCGWDVPHGTAIVRQALAEFKIRLDNLAADPKNIFLSIRRARSRPPSGPMNCIPNPPALK